MKKSICIVGGTFDNTTHGKVSSVVEYLIANIIFSQKFESVYNINGGNYVNLRKMVEGNELSKYNVILWMPNISNDLPKIRNIKELYPKAILISSKNNYSKNYSFQDIISHGLALKSNLILEIRKQDEKLYCGRVLDPLGNVWTSSNTTDFTPHFDHIASIISKRAVQLTEISRQATIQSPEEPEQISTNQKEFFEIVKRSGEIFHDLITPAEGTTRFLGNASFRCERGFPSMRLENGNIYVSRRNVDKRYIDENSFVQVGINKVKNILWYRGDNKPSVDTPIQLRLYEKLPRINYMIHSHVYVKDSPFTKRMIPCGGLEEINEIMEVVKENDFLNKTSFSINLKGHGSIVFTKFLNSFRSFDFIPRPMPEIQIIE